MTSGWQGLRARLPWNGIATISDPIGRWLYAYVNVRPTGTTQRDHSSTLAVLLVGLITYQGYQWRHLKRRVKLLTPDDDVV
ncbi:hypothetical protein GCM10028799_58170 [Kribbella italica]